MTRFMAALAGLSLLTGIAAILAQGSSPPAGPKRWLIAHREASAYTPENTVPAFRLAAGQRFRASAVTGFPDVGPEMAHFLEAWRVDGVITDNPDLMPAPRPARR